MGTRQVYDEKLRAGNLQHDPTMNPGLGSARCPRSFSLINSNPISSQSPLLLQSQIFVVSSVTEVIYFYEKGEWAIISVLHDAAGVVFHLFISMSKVPNGCNSQLGFLHCCCIQELALRLELTCFQLSLNAVRRHSMRLRAPHIMQYPEQLIVSKDLIMSIFSKNLVYPFQSIILFWLRIRDRVFTIKKIHGSILERSKVYETTRQHRVRRVPRFTLTSLI